MNPGHHIDYKQLRKVNPKAARLAVLSYLAFASMDELHEGYEKILDEHGKKCLVIEHVEDLPEEALENHLAAALDVCGY